ncbi:MAG: AAA family ATPase [Candidatus Asgardarchaeia archaeon]
MSAKWSVFVKEIHVKNFKSYKSTRIPLNKFNVVVGPNASGKTNLVELFKLIKKIYTESSDINPFLDWWGYQNVVWQRDETLPISVKFVMNINKYDVMYETTFTGIGGKFHFLKEHLKVNGIVDIVREGNWIFVKHDEKYLNKVWKHALNVIEESNDTLLFIEKKIGRIPKNKDFYLNEKTFVEIKEDKSFLNRVFIIPFLMDNKIGLFTIYTTLPEEKEVKTGVIPLIISSNTSANKENSEYVIRKIALSILDFFANSRLLFSLNARKIKENIQPVKKEKDLLDDGSNLQNVLYNLYLEENQIPTRIKNALAVLFPNMNVRFELTQDSRLFIKVMEKNLELYPPMISDGLYKILAILTALESEHSILVIDEIENSLHPEAIELIIDELKNNDKQVIITTHSPAVIDIVDPADLLIIERDNEGCSKARRIKNPQKLKQRLHELGITVSEGWLYGKL